MVNGDEQFLLIGGVDRNPPVLLFLIGTFPSFRETEEICGRLVRAKTNVGRLPTGIDEQGLTITHGARTDARLTLTLTEY